MNSGQAFRWQPLDQTKQVWLGVVSGKLVKLTADGATVYSDGDLSGRNLLERYLSTSDDLETIFRNVPFDPLLDQVRNDLRGLRLLTQDPWECLISFVCSINCNIPSIRMKIENLCNRFGKSIKTDLNFKVHSFPTPETLAKASKRDLLACRLGFRWRYVKFIAKQVASEELNLENIAALPYSTAQNELMSSTSGKTQGVGPKVADCALLYSYHKTESFPIDVWMLRCLNRYYPSLDSPNQLTAKRYTNLSDSMRKKFGKYAGYAQLYLYVAMRTNTIIQRTTQV